MDQFLILVILMGGTQAFTPETKCNVTKNTCPCSVTLGGSVYIQVMTNASGHRMVCKKELPSGSVKVFALKKEKLTLEDEFKNRTSFITSNGTFKITNVEQTDSGQYNIEVFNQDGVLINNIKFSLEIKVSESSFPFLIPVCAALGALLIVVSCCFMYREARRCKKVKKKTPDVGWTAKTVDFNESI